LDSEFAALFEGEMLLAVDTLNIDAASFAQIEEAARSALGPLARVHGPAEGSAESSALDQAVTHIVVRTVTERGKQHNPVTGSGGMLLGRVVDADPRRPGPPVALGDRIATLASLTLTPLRLDRVLAVRRASAQVDVEGEAVVFSSAPFVKLPDDLPERLAVAVLDVAGAAPQVARLVRPGQVVVVLGAGGKSGIVSAVQARRSAGPSAHIVGVEASERAARELRELEVCSGVVVGDARDPLATRRAVLEQTGGREADVTFSCVNVPGAEMSAVLATRDRGVAYFFAMSTSFTRAALGAEGVGKDVDLFIGNGFASGHAEHTLALLRAEPRLRALFERRYG
jgi:L-erythro-3,5-diaminohexanoate dehydrogenase